MKLNLVSILEKISPVLINPREYSITISLSKRFFLFALLKTAVEYIENEPYLNFISILKHYKLLNDYLHGSIEELYRDRSKSYFKRFFYDKDLYNLVKSDIENNYAQNKNMNLTISKEGVILYDNYKPHKFNFLLLTIHSGRWLPKDVASKQLLNSADRFLEEDIDIDKIYGQLVLKYGGIWIDSKLSRFACDYNRASDKAIYTDNSEKWISKIWREKLSRQERNRLLEGHSKFYFTLSKLIDAYRFNIILDGHSMKDSANLPEISFGTRYIPKFYMPIVEHMKSQLIQAGYVADMNKPYMGGHILQYLQEKFPHAFICSMEINKKLYMNPTREKSDNLKISQLSTNILKIFDFLKETTYPDN